MFKTLSAVIVCAAGTANAQIYLSMSDNIDNQLPGLTFLDGDVVQTDTAGSYGSLFFAESNITPGSDVDAFHLMSDGSMLLSVLFNGRTLGGLTFDDGDLVRYDPNTNTASIFELNETNMAGDDIDAVTMLPDGNIAFSSTNSTNTLGGVAVADGDILMYNVPGGTFSVLYPEASIFDDADGELNALHFNPDGTFLISTFADEVISGVQFRNGDLIRWDPISDTASLYFSEDSFLDSNGHNIDAVYVAVPAPGTALLALGGLVAVRRRR